jgi:hypothetical protein
MQMPRYTPALRIKVATAALLGRVDEARQAARRLLDVSPSESVASVRAYWKASLPHTPDTVGAILTGWRSARMPEE